MHCDPVHNWRTPTPCPTESEMTPMSGPSRQHARIFTCVFQSCCLILAFWLISQRLAAAQEEKEKQPPTPGPMLAQGTEDFDTPDLTLTLVRSSQTVAALKPKGGSDFDFTPGD